MRVAATNAMGQDKSKGSSQFPVLSFQQNQIFVRRKPKKAIKEEN